MWPTVATALRIGWWVSFLINRETSRSEKNHYCSLTDATTCNFTSVQQKCKDIIFKKKTQIRTYSCRVHTTESTQSTQHISKLYTSLAATFMFSVRFDFHLCVMTALRSWSEWVQTLTHLVKNIQQFRAEQFWRAISNSGLWLGSLQLSSLPSLPPSNVNITSYILIPNVKKQISTLLTWLAVLYRGFF